MKFLTLSQLQQATKSDGEDDEILQFYANAAEAACETFCKRSIFKSEDDLSAALQTVPARTQTVQSAYTAALEAADLIEDLEIRRFSVGRANYAYGRQLHAINRDVVGMVARDDFLAAALLLTAMFYREREVGGLTPQIERMLNEYIWMGD